MRQDKNTPIVLAGDIGGTHTRLALFSGKTRLPEPILSKTYASRNAPDLASILDDFLQDVAFDISGACFGVAGPVTNGISRTTNLPWEISENNLKNRFQWPRIRLINDINAAARAIPFLQQHELFVLNKGIRLPDSPIGILAPGTGLGMALIILHHNAYLPIPSEGGHMDFAPNSNAQVRLWQHLHKSMGHVSVERILSGPGLVTIYSWIKQAGLAAEPPALAQRLKNEDPARVISETAINENIPICVQALDIFVSVFGAVAGNLALAGFTRGGVYLGGGIAPKILPALENNKFMSAFENKGRFKKTMGQIPVTIILHKQPALMGAAAFALADGI